MNKTELLLQSLLELADTNTFTHAGHDYDLTKLNKLIKDRPTQKFQIKDLDWIFKYDDPVKDHPERVASAWLSVPIIVINWKDKLVVLDGLHRLKKAENEGLTSLAGRLVTMDDLDKVRADERRS